MKRGREKIYKTEAEKKEAHLAAVRRWQAKNSDRIRKLQNAFYRRKVGGLLKHERLALETLKPELQKLISAPPPPPDIEARLAKLEQEIKDILLDIEEVLKDNKELRNLVKWGKR